MFALQQTSLQPYRLGDGKWRNMNPKWIRSTTSVWEEAGRPMGEADRHWAMAQDIERARQVAKRPLGASRQKKRSVTKN
jgi:hypothetical protein